MPDGDRRSRPERPPTLYTLEEAAALTHVTPKTFKRRAAEAIRANKVNPYRPGRGYLYTPADIEAILEFSRWRSNSYRPVNEGRTTSSAAVKAVTSLKEAQAHQISRKLDSFCAAWKKRSAKSPV